MKRQQGIAVALWIALSAALAEFTTRVADWFVMTDELLYERLALSVDRLGSPLPHVHGVLVGNLNQLYPLLLAPVFAGGSIQHDLHNAHVLNAFVMASAALPAYALARRLETPAWGAALAALLTVAVPWIVLSSFLLTEVVAYPVFVWALLAFHAAVTRPSMRNDALATLALVVAVGARTQLAVLALVLAVAVALHSRARTHPLLTVVYTAGIVAVLAALALGHNPLGTYGATTHGNPIPVAFFPALLTHFATLALGFGLLPVLIGGAWLVANARRDAYATIACTATVVMTAEVASYDVRFGGNIVRDRYLFYLAPVFALALVAALSRAPVARRWLAAPLAVLVAGFALSPLPLFDKLNVDTPASILDNYLRAHLGGLSGARVALVVAAFLVVILVVEGELLLRRSLLVALVAVLALAGTTARTGYAFERLFRVNGTAGRPLTTKMGPVAGWIDSTVGRNANVTAIPFPTLVGDYFASAGFWWDAEFWNASVDRTAGVPGEFEWTPSTFPKLDLRLDQLGRASISPPGDVLQALGDTRFHLAGSVVLFNRGVFLVEPERPWRADWSTTGLFDDGWTKPGAVAHIHVYPYPGQSGPARRTLTVSLFAPTGVASRPFALKSNLGAATGAVGGDEVSQEITVCVPPDRSADADLTVTGSSIVTGDLRTPATSSSPRRAGAFVSRVYLSGAVGPECQLRKA
jgi:hypothetical protein